MSTKLIYHIKESSAGGISPFDKTITEIVKNKNVCIVCPYISVGYLGRITQLANTWHLVTDVEEWIISHNIKQRQSTKNFILDNLSDIHHYKDIHAKVIVADDKAFIGSSNLTAKGIRERVEMSVLIEEKEQVCELQRWFKDLWIGSESVKTQDLEKYVSSIESLPSSGMDRPIASLPSKATSINAKLVDVEAINIQVSDILTNNQESHERLIKWIKKITSNRDWINDYFDLAREMIDFTELTSDDPMLVTSITKNDGIGIIIGQRYVLKPQSNGRIGLIMPLDYDQQNYNTDRVVHEAEDYFFRNKIREARWLVFERTDRIKFHENIKIYWKKAVLSELERGKISGFKQYHEPIVYEAIMNPTYRAKLLDETFI
ncbi:MAG: hypothetical protein EF813_09530 [Methanosarcinales archaeon]|nr:MAG: hypothetical protein EF813_09530 [Methanosarcinales archaeon]